MYRAIMVLLLVLNTVAATGGFSSLRPLATDDVVVLTYPYPYVDIKVLDNDVNLTEDLWVVAATGEEGSKVVNIDRSTVRVFIDWSGFTTPASAVNYGYAMVGQGYYVVSNGAGHASARWTVWYYPRMVI